jgi:CO/xanthine dehydrogenase Mo-binding subunit
LFFRSGPFDPPEHRSQSTPDCAARAAGFFVPFVTPQEESMANHLTPDELAKEMGIDRDEVIRICLEEGVPIYHGKIDKTLFQASLEAVGAATSAPSS